MILTHRLMVSSTLPQRKPLRPRFTRRAGLRASGSTAPTTAVGLNTGQSQVGTHPPEGHTRLHHFAIVYPDRREKAHSVLRYLSLSKHCKWGCRTNRVNRTERKRERSEERRVGKECRSRWSPYH